MGTIVLLFIWKEMSVDKSFNVCNIIKPTHHMN